MQLRNRGFRESAAKILTTRSGRWTMSSHDLAQPGSRDEPCQLQAQYTSCPEACPCSGRGGQEARCRGSASRDADRGRAAQPVFGFVGAPSSSRRHLRAQVRQRADGQATNHDIYFRHTGHLVRAFGLSYLARLRARCGRSCGLVEQGAPLGVLLQFPDEHEIVGLVWAIVPHVFLRPAVTRKGLLSPALVPAKHGSSTCAS